jgi:hypothetical protein
LAYLFISLLFFLFASDRIISQVGHIKDKMNLRNGCAYDGEHERKEEKENEKEKKTKQTSGLHIATCK